MNIDINLLWQQLKARLQEQAQAYVREHAQDAMDLSVEEVRALLFESGAQFVAVPNLPDTVTPAAGALLQEYLTERQNSFAIIAAAQRRRIEIVAKVRLDLQSTALGIAQSAMQIVVGALLGKAVM